MQQPIIVNAEGWTFLEDLTQIEYYGIYAYIAEAYGHALDETHDLDEGTLPMDEVENLFGFAPSGGNVTCTKRVEWPGFEHLGPVDYFSLTDNHTLCAVFIYEDVPNVYLRLN